jgi:preprotein translocase subunit YajC
MPAYLFLIVLLALVWLLLIRPRQRAMKAQRQQLQELEVGDEILTAGGLYGFVRSIDEDGDELRVELAPGLEVRMARRAVATVLTERQPEVQKAAPELEAGEGQDEPTGANLPEG